MLRRFGGETEGSCDASPQFPLNLVRDFEKTAPKRLAQLASADATEASCAANCRDRHRLVAFPSHLPVLPNDEISLGDDGASAARTQFDPSFPILANWRAHIVRVEDFALAESESALGDNDELQSASNRLRREQWVMGADWWYVPAMAGGLSIVWGLFLLPSNFHPTLFISAFFATGYAVAILLAPGFSSHHVAMAIGLQLLTPMMLVFGPITRYPEYVSTQLLMTIVLFLLLRALPFPKWRHARFTASIRQAYSSTTFTIRALLVLTTVVALAIALLRSGYFRLAYVSLVLTKLGPPLAGWIPALVLTSRRRISIGKMVAVVVVGIITLVVLFLTSKAIVDWTGAAIRLRWLGFLGVAITTLTVTTLMHLPFFRASDEAINNDTSGDNGELRSTSNGLRRESWVIRADWWYVPAMASGLSIGLSLMPPAEYLFHSPMVSPFHTVFVPASFIATGYALVMLLAPGFSIHHVVIAVGLQLLNVLVLSGNSKHDFLQLLVAQLVVTSLLFIVQRALWLPKLRHARFTGSMTKSSYWMNPLAIGAFFLLLAAFATLALRISYLQNHYFHYHFASQLLFPLLVGSLTGLAMTSLRRISIAVIVAVAVLCIILPVVALTSLLGEYSLPRRMIVIAIVTMTVINLMHLPFYRASDDTIGNPIGIDST